jgi:flagellar protein FlaG
MNINTIQNPDTSEAATRVSSAAPVRVLEPVEALQKSDGQEQEGSLSVKDAKEITEILNDYMDDLQTNLGFSIREDLGSQVIVEIKNRKTDEMVKQIPSEELLRIMENMKELSGIIFDQSV